MSAGVTEATTAVEVAPRPWRPRWLPLLFIVELLTVTLLQTPNELFFRFGFSDSGSSLTIDVLIRRGYRPTIDFGYIYGLLPLLLNRVWFAVVGATPQACWWAIVVCDIMLAWGLARFAAAQRVVDAELSDMLAPRLSRTEIARLAAMLHDLRAAMPRG